MTQQTTEQSNMLADHHWKMKKAFAADSNPDLNVRLDRLKRLETALSDYEERLIAAVQEDFSYRSEYEIRSYDVTTCIWEIRAARKNLKKWMRPRRRSVPMHFRPAKGKVIPQPRGVVGIIAPWNFPIYVTVSPLIPALAAGNRVIIKPSEITPRTSDVIKEMIEDRFDPMEISVFVGGPEVAAAVTSLPLDHLLFTGSTKVGVEVAKAAAENLTPVTLELGGKSPCIVSNSANLSKAARRIAFGKGINAGQVCVSPDYALVPRDKLDAFVAEVETWTRKFYPSFQGNPDFTAIVTDRHRQRIRDLVSEAESRGTRVVRFEDTSEADYRLEAPVLLVDPPHDIRAMTEEIFGPILPILPYDRPEEVLEVINQRAHPLALYIFAEATHERDYWLSNTISGGVCVNDVMLHVVADSLPFGGVGQSGMGAYHGITGFETFSHMKPIFYQSRINGGFLTEPPFRGFKAKLPSILRKIV